MDTAKIEVDGEVLRRYVEPIEEFVNERKAVNRKITAKLRAAKDAGYQTPILRMIIAERALDRQVWADQQVLLATYREALGMRLGDYVDTPLGAAAMEAAGDEVAARRAQNIAATEASRDARNGAEKPRPFAKQPVHEPKRGRGRARKVLFDQEHPLGTA
jgi:uncharacterized protein (UPF0335 family)